MKNLFIIATLVVCFTACKQNKSSENNSANASTNSKAMVADDVKGDGLKSAIYETETLLPGRMGATTTKITFDEYGKTSRTEIKSVVSFGGKSMTTEASSIMLNGYIYTWKTDAKTGNKIKIDDTKFDPTKTDFSKLSDEMKKKTNFKEEGTEVLDGRTCKVGSFNTEQMKGKIWMWKQIPVQMEMDIMGKTITSKLKSLQENVSIPASTFEVPTDVEFKEIEIPATAAK